jgi:serine phosphatase RsbU (regulator of sigma subunit)
MLTDGIIETADERGQMLGMEEFAKEASRVDWNQHAEASASLLATVHAFGGRRPATDDRTLLTVEYLS